MSQKERTTAKSNWRERLRTWEKEWEEKYPTANSIITWTSVLVISLALSASFYLFSIPFGTFIILSTEALKTLIEAEATIIGLFGLIAVYLLTSYDSRIDKLEEKMLEAKLHTNRKI